MKKHKRITALIAAALIIVTLTIDYQIRGSDSPAAYVECFMVWILSPGPLPLF